jgi:hypothetical protein
MVTSRKRQHNTWQRRLSQHWQQNPITHCEVRFEGCYGTYGLAPAHSKDRGDIHTESDFGEVVAACQHCHCYLDHKMSKDERLVTVKEIIQRRESRLDIGA